MRLRTLSDLQDAVDRETAWRKRELTTILFQATSERESLRPTALRMCIALLYAHWEGWIKSVGELYLEFVAQQRLRYDELSDPFLGAALKSRLNEMGAAKAPAIHTGFASFIRSDLSTVARFGTSAVINTQSNLSSAVLRKIVERLGLAYEPYDLRDKLIDERLLARRNYVAHGEYLELTLREFELLHAEVLDMLQAFTTGVMNGAALRGYRL